MGTNIKTPLLRLILEMIAMTFSIVMMATEEHPIGRGQLLTSM